MYREHTVGVVVPAYNEEGHVGAVVDAIPAFVDRIYVVDDASTDGTWDEIRRHAEHEPATEWGTLGERSSQRVPTLTQLSDGGTDVGSVVPIRHETNRGAGGALKTGYRHALADGMDLTATIDGDGQMDLTQLPLLLDPLVRDEADYAKGDRLGRDDRRGMPRFRLAGNFLLTLLTRVASGYWQTSDPQNGYTAITYEALSAVDIGSLYEYYGYCDELLVRLNVADMRVANVAMASVYGDETSGISYSSYIPKVSGMLFRNFRWRLRTKYLGDTPHPLAACYLAGGVSGVFGLLSALRTSLSLAGQTEPDSTRRGVTRTLAAVVFAVVSLLAAVVLDRRENAHLEVER